MNIITKTKNAISGTIFLTKYVLILTFCHLLLYD